MLKCVVCQSLTDKYKCPKCLEYYCSVQCYKEHKSTTAACANKYDQLQQTAAGQLSAGDEPTCYEPFKTEDTVSQEKLKLLRNSKSLLELLYNPHLRNLLREVDVAQNAWAAMRAAMQEPLFIEFADECLKLVEESSEENI